MPLYVSGPQGAEVEPGQLPEEAVYIETHTLRSNEEVLLGNEETEQRTWSKYNEILCLKILCIHYYIGPFYF